MTNLSTLLYWKEKKNVFVVVRIHIGIYNEEILVQSSLNANRKKLTFAPPLKLSDCLLNNLATRFNRIDENLIMAMPTFLDPRFKRKGLTSDSALTRCRKIQVHFSYFFTSIFAHTEVNYWKKKCSDWI